MTASRPEAPYRYRVGGLPVVSHFVLPEGAPWVAQVSDTTTPVLTIEDGRHLALPPPRSGNGRTVDARRVRLEAPGVGQVLVEDGARVVVWPAADASDGSIGQYLTGPVLAIACMQRGLLVLHGAVVRIGTQAVVLLGASGHGKSTTAAACAARGYDVIADDLAIIDQRVPEGPGAGGGGVRPGNPHVSVRGLAPLVRLRDARSVGVDAEASWQAADKTAILLDTQPSPASTPLAGLVCLAWDDDVGMRQQSPVEAALQLVAHAFCLPAFRDAQHAATLPQAAALAAACPVWTLGRPSRLEALDAVVDLLARTVQARGDDTGADASV